MIRIEMSIIPYVGGGFDIIFKLPGSGEEVTLSGEGELTNEDMEILQKIAPPCVWTEYQRLR